MFTLCGIVFLVIKFKPNLVLYYEEEEKILPKKEEEKIDFRQCPIIRIRVVILKIKSSCLSIFIFQYYFFMVKFQKLKDITCKKRFKILKY
jgi:hypothetical protein